LREWKVSVLGAVGRLIRMSGSGEAQRDQNVVVVMGGVDGGW
jgi:hypothetical protein